MGAVPQGAMGGQAQDGPHAYDAGYPSSQHMVQEAPSSVDQTATRGDVAEARGAFRVLRDNRKLDGASEVSPRSHPELAEVARPQRPAKIDAVEAFFTHAGAIPAPASARGPLHLQTRSESVIRGAGCPNRARPDLLGGRKRHRMARAKRAPQAETPDTAKIAPKRRRLPSYPDGCWGFSFLALTDPGLTKRGSDNTGAQ